MTSYPDPLANNAPAHCSLSLGKGGIWNRPRDTTTPSRINPIEVRTHGDLDVTIRLLLYLPTGIGKALRGSLPFPYVQLLRDLLPQPVGRRGLGEGQEQIVNMGADEALQFPGPVLLHEQGRFML